MTAADADQHEATTNNNNNNNSSSITATKTSTRTPPHLLGLDRHAGVAAAVGLVVGFVLGKRNVV